MADSRNHARASAYRMAVAAFLSLRTGHNVEPVSPYLRGRLSEHYAVDRDRQSDPGHLRGVPGATCLLSASHSPTPGPLLDDAVDLAEGRGTIGVAVLWRRGRSVADQLAVVRLADLADLLATASAER